MFNFLIFFTGILFIYTQTVYSDDSEKLEVVLKKSLKGVVNFQDSLDWQDIKIELEAKKRIQSKLKIKKEIPDSLRYGNIQVAE